METDRWLEFLSSKLKSQISLENAAKAQTWGLLLLAILGLGFALNTVGSGVERLFVFGTKILFLIGFHLVTLLAFYVPSLLQRGQKPAAELLRLRDFTSLVLVSLTLGFYAVINCMLSWQMTVGLEEMGMSQFFGFTAWVNLILTGFYLAAFVFFFAGLFFYPNAIVKILEKSARAFWVLLALHAVTALLLGIGYNEIAPLGSTGFFEQFRAAGLFWVFAAASVLLVSRLLGESAIPALSALEFEITSGRLTRGEDILARYKEAFVPQRLDYWLRNLSHFAASRAHEIAAYTHQAVAFVGTDKPTELDLRQVEDRYRRAEALYRKLEKVNQRYLVSLSLLEMGEVERERAEGLKDQFSRELRNAKLELAQVRKKIDEKLVSLRNAFPQQALLPEPPVEQIPVNNPRG